MEKESTKTIEELVEEAIKSKLTIEVKNWQFESEIILKYDGKEISKATVEA